MECWQLAGHTLHSRLLVGTGRYPSPQVMKEAIAASGAEIVTVALRRIALAGSEASPLEVLGEETYRYLPNSAGCFTAEEAVRTLRLAREVSESPLVKLEVIGDTQTLYPDVQETLKAAKILVQEGFQVMAYTNDDPVVARQLEAAGCVAVMPLAAPIGSGLGIQNPRAIETIVRALQVPVLVDAGLGTASDACLAMELGCTGVLLNTAIAQAKNPVAMATAMRHAVLAGRHAYLAGRMQPQPRAQASSPELGTLTPIQTGNA